MAYLSQTGVQAVADGSVSELLEQWVGEQLGRAEAFRRERPRIGILAARGTLRDGGWPVYGGDGPSVHAILEAGGFPASFRRSPCWRATTPRSSSSTITCLRCSSRCSGP